MDENYFLVLNFGENNIMYENEYDVCVYNFFLYCSYGLFYTFHSVTPRMYGICGDVGILPILMQICNEMV